MSGTNSPAPALSRTIVLPVPDPPMDLLLAWPPKSPGTTQDYSLDVDNWAAAQGETITSFQALVSAPGSSVSPLMAAQQPLAAGSNVCTVTLAAGVSATQCAVTFVINTATRQLTLTCWIVVVSLSGVPNRFGGFAYLGTALDPATAGQFAALNAQLALETQARIAADAALALEIGQATSAADAAVALAESTQGSFTLMLDQFHAFEQEVETQLLALTASNGSAISLASDGTIRLTPPSGSDPNTIIGLKSTGVAPGTYAGLQFDEYGRFVGVASIPAVFLLTQAGAPILISGGAPNTALAISDGSAGSSGGSTPPTAGLMLLEDASGYMLAEDGTTFLSLES